jgi:hypothetical protein
MNKRQVKAGMVLKLKYEYKESLFLVIFNNKEKEYVEAFDQEFNTVKIPRDDLKKYKITGQYFKDKWNFMFDRIR